MQLKVNHEQQFDQGETWSVDNQVYDGVGFPVAHFKDRQGEHVIGGIEGGNADKQKTEQAVLVWGEGCFFIYFTSIFGNIAVPTDVPDPGLLLLACGTLTAPACRYHSKGVPGAGGAVEVDPAPFASRLR